MPFWHSAFPLQNCTWPCIEFPCVGQVEAHWLCALLVVAVPQQTCPLVQSLFPPQLNAAVRMGHCFPWAMQVPVALWFASSPTQHVWIWRSQFGVEPHWTIEGAVASSGSIAGGPASRAVATPPSAGTDPELELPDPELDPAPVLEPLDPVLELLDSDPEDDPPPLPLAPPPKDPSSPRSLGKPPLLAHPAATKASPAKKKRRDPQVLDR